LPINSALLDILELRVEEREKGVSAWRCTLFILPGLGVDWDVVKKKAVDKGNEAKAKGTTEQDNDEVEQRAGTEAGKKRKKPRPVRCIHRHTDVEFRREFPEVFNALVKRAKNGGTAETRLLLQIGKFGDPKAVKRRGGKSLSEMLLDELKRRQDEREAAVDGKRAAEQMARTNETGSEGATSDGDAENG
jgi:hypothetical protein